MPCNDIKNVSREKTVPSRGNKQQSEGIKSFYSNIFYGFEYKKNSISKLSIKMFINRKTRVGIAYILSLPAVKQLSLDMIQLFAGHCPMSGANIQACR